MRSYYFKGKFLVKTDDEKKEIFSKGKKIGEKLIKLFPNSAAVRYWYLVNLGSWAEVYGTMAAAKEGVAGLMRDHSKKIIEIDPSYSNGGGYFMLGAVHFKSPYIPFILSWPSNDLAIKNLEKAYGIGDSTPSQTVYLAQALYKDGQWQDGQLTDKNTLTLHEGSPVLHYGQGCFEGMKAITSVSNKVLLFRPDQNLKRFK